MIDLNQYKDTTFGYSKLEFTPLALSYFLSQIRPEGKIVYEYNPLRNYRLTRDTDINGLHPGDVGYDKTNVIEGGSIVDLDTSELNFSLNNPLTIEAQPSYDGSVNLIFNDNRNIPRLINSRFSVLQNNTYEVVDRIGNNDTNLYDDSQFDLDTSLYKRVNTIPSITFNGVLSGGNLKVGNYVVYIKYADADNNETDFVGESGIISCFIGNDQDPFSVNGGFRDQLSSKSISLLVDNIDGSYDYIKVYYTRTTSDVDGNRIVTAHKINKKYVVRNGICAVMITGDEETVDIPVSDINVTYFIADKVKAQTICQNMLFMGNINKPDLMYRDLSDISLRMLPYLEVTDSDSLIGNVSSDYADNSVAATRYEYYNTNNIYYHVGYWNEEAYRLGVVYVMKDGSLSPVYNIRGRNIIPTRDQLFGENGYTSTDKSILNEDGDREYLEVDESTFEISSSKNYENSKGVIKINHTDVNNSNVYGIGVYIPKEVADYLTGMVQGLFFVRQKRIPTILAQAYTLPRDAESQVPIIKYNGDNYVSERFINDERILTQDYSSRLYKITQDSRDQASCVAICPEYSVRQSFFNQLFTGTTYPVRKSEWQPGHRYLDRTIYNDRHYHVSTYTRAAETNYDNVKIVGVPDNTPIIQVEDVAFRGRAGEAEEAFRFRYLDKENRVKEANNLIRGIYSSYLGIVGNIDECSIINIYIPGYNPYNISTLFNTRYQDNSPYYAIGDRLGIDRINEVYESLEDGTHEGYTSVFYRGDCYICTYTHRLNRNFQDPSAPINDEIVDANTWKDNYDTENTENNSKINRGDVNAIKLGSWITFKVRSSYNLSLRSLDPSYPTEEGLTGLKRGFYPLQDLSVEGNYKIPSSAVINTGYSSTVSEKQMFTLPDVPYIKNRFDTRIIYSDVSVGDAFKNGFRVFQLTHYRDYPRIYGGIMKMVELFGNILCIFEHGVAVIPVNERAVAGEGAGGDVFINTSNVLPENPKMLSDTYGTQWPESVVQTPYYVYGVDTVGKKIWRTNGDQLEVISDFKIQEFLNENISLSERELSPIIGIRNVKGHYNAYKQDVMFTFYDDLYGFEEKVWNICYNEIMQKWVTFYSWIPSYSANIDNIHFSFNRDTSKWISKLASSQMGSTSEDGIVLSSVVLDDWETHPKGKAISLDIVNRAIPNDYKTGINVTKKFELVRDNFGMYKHFDIENGKDGSKLIMVSEPKWTHPVIQLNIQCEIDGEYKSTGDIPTDISEYLSGWKEYVSMNLGLYQSSIALTTKEILENGVNEGLNLTTDFWKHGQSGIIDIKDKIKPCYWYGKQHPFEYEFVVVDNPGVHKIFNNLQIVSNKAQPDSFHYEIVGEVYDFNDDKQNMYIRQEATKDFYQYNGSDILYNRNFLDLRGAQRDILRNWKPTGVKDKSTMFPLYYARVDTFNEVEDYYKGKTAPNKDYVNLSGSEIVYNEKLNEFRVWTHAKAVDIKDEKAGRLRGNMNYQEDIWDIQINPITFVQRNEPTWNTSTVNDELINKVPISIGNSPIPDDMKGFDITETTPIEDYMPQDLRDLGYNMDDIDISDWWANRKETKLRDKYIKIRVRYTGDELAIITALKTLFTISYA